MLLMGKRSLSSQKCLACSGAMPKLSKKEIKENLKELNRWEIKNKNLYKKIKFKNFKSALSFVNKIGAIAEKEGHHPDISFTWGRVEISVFTHEVKALTINDFILAAKIDKIKK